MGLAFTGRDPSTVNDENPLATPGALYVYGGAEYRYLQAKDLAWADGDVLNPAAADGTAGSKDRNGTANISAIKTIGVAVGAVTADYYGYALVRGYHDAVKTDGGVVAADYLVSHTADGQADTMADGEEEQVFGYALANDTSASTVPAMINCT